MEEMCEAKTASSVISWTVDMVVVVVNFMQCTAIGGVI